jgi:mono/diheme cytochrome c family protein
MKRVRLCAGGAARLVFVGAAAALLFLAACGGRREAAADSDPTRTLFRRHCAACHGPDGQGGQVGQLRVPSLKEGRALTYTDQQFFQQISEGRANMPPFKYTLTDEQMRALARFVREEIQGRK